MSDGWIGVDFDGTLAQYNGWQGEDSLGAPVPVMVERVKGWLAAGREVRIVTARASTQSRVGRSVERSVLLIQEWCEEYLGQRLAVTCEKDYGMVELWDDRCVRVERNTGRILSAGISVADPTS